MGLDMMIYKMKKFENATLKDAFAVESYLDLLDYRKEHPEYKGDMQDWCGMDKPSDRFIRFLGSFAPPCLEVAYWRKANAIHRWFVKNVQDGEDDCCAHRPLTKDDLLTLRKLCVEVRDDHTKAAKLLPTRSGFFFGDTEYNDWYFSDIKETIEKIDELLAHTDFETDDLYYLSSW